MPTFFDICKHQKTFVYQILADFSVQLLETTNDVQKIPSTNSSVSSPMASLTSIKLTSSPI